MNYRVGILTSLYDDYAVNLLKKFDRAIGEGFIKAEIPFVFCSRGEGSSRAVNRRIAILKQLKHIGDLVLLPSESFKPELRGRDRKQWGFLYDREVMRLLPKADSYLNVGYMLIIGPDMLEHFDIVNLHPALPWIGPVGMWPKVMEEQAERPLPYLLAIERDELQDALPKVMEISSNKAGGMLHLVGEEPDRGPVISWYEFPLISSKLIELWLDVTRELQEETLDDLKKKEIWQKLIKEIRYEEFKGEDPLILLTYRKLARGEWKIKDRKLWINGREFPGGYCLNCEIGEYLKEHGVQNLISSSG